MTRPCLLVIDREHAGSISTRKLVIESAKFNVITAYSGSEAIETFDRFPAVDGVILNASIADVPCLNIITTLRAHAAKLPIIVIQGPGTPVCPGANHYIDSFEPAELLELLQRQFPRATKAIQQQDAILKAEENQG
jgi:DNA-binding response OmpR family regulator